MRGCFGMMATGNPFVINVIAQRLRAVGRVVFLRGSSLRVDRAQRTFLCPQKLTFFENALAWGECSMRLRMRLRSAGEGQGRAAEGADKRGKV